MTDDELFRHIISRREIPREHAYLVREGVSWGWSEPRDAIVTALRTLRHKYLLSSSVEPYGRSQLSKSLFKGDRHQPKVFFDNPDPSKDAAIPGLDANHAFLISRIKMGDELAVRWLLDSDVSTTTGGGSWFWSCVDAANLRCTSHTHENSEANRAAVVAHILGNQSSIQAAGRGPRAFGQTTGTIIQQLCARYSLAGLYGIRPGSHLEILDDELDAVIVATRSKKADILRLILDHEHCKGRWFTDEGKRVLKKCLDISREDVGCHGVLRSYCVDIEDDRVGLRQSRRWGDRVSLFASPAFLSERRFAFVAHRRSFGRCPSVGSGGRCPSFCGANGGFSLLYRFYDERTNDSHFPLPRKRRMFSS